ncbi:MAG TPA: aminotransferase class IV, partial [Polyangiaceae bacterium]
FDSAPPDISWRDVVQQVLSANDLVDATAAVKILVAAGKQKQRRPLGTLLVTAREYVHRLAHSRTPGLNLAVYPERRLSSLADHKTLNYLTYKLAGHWAADHGADEALILNEDGSVSETNTANVFCLRAGVVYCPSSAHALPGITEGAIVRLLTSWGTAVERRKLTLDDLKDADFVFVSNSLMGAVPVATLDGCSLPIEGNLCTRLNVALFGQDFRASGVVPVTLMPPTALGERVNALTKHPMSSAS